MLRTFEAELFAQAGPASCRTPKSPASAAWWRACSKRLLPARGCGSRGCGCPGRSLTHSRGLPPAASIGGRRAPRARRAQRPARGVGARPPPSRLCPAAPSNTWRTWRAANGSAAGAPRRPMGARGKTRAAAAGWRRLKARVGLRSWPRGEDYKSRRALRR